MAKPRTASVRSAEAVIDKARLSATANLTARFATSSVAWPDSLAKEDKAALSAYLARRVSVRAKLSGLEVVLSKRGEDGICTVVVAVPDTSISMVEKITIKEAFKVLLEPRFMRAHFAENRRAFYSLASAAGRTLPEQLKGTDFNSWDDDQICAFCGISRQKAPNDATPENAGQADDSGATAADVEEIVRPEFVLPPSATANENETIGF